MSAPISHPTIARFYVPGGNRCAEWLDDRLTHAPFGRAGGNPNSTSIDLTKEQLKLYQRTFIGDVWRGERQYHVCRLDRAGLGPLVEFRLANHRVKGPKLHTSDLCGSTEAFAQFIYDTLLERQEMAA